MKKNELYHFDADKHDIRLNDKIKTYIRKITKKYGNLEQTLKFLETKTKKHEIPITCFFVANEVKNKYYKYKNILVKFRNWLKKQDVDIEKQSDNLKYIISKAKKFQSNSTVIKYGMKQKKLDNLITFCETNIAIEIETSKNSDNGISTLAYAINDKKANFGIMISPMTEKSSGRADRDSLVSKIDKLYEKIAKQINPPPIFGLALVRNIDIVRIIKKNIKTKKSIKLENNRRKILQFISNLKF